MKINQLTASKIKEVRNRVGYTAEAMANGLGISKTAYSQLENGHTEITLTRIEAIAGVCGVPMQELIPDISSNYQISNGNAGNYNTNNTVTNNFFAESTEDKLQSLIDSLQQTVNAIKQEKK